MMHLRRRGNHFIFSSAGGFSLDFSSHKCGFKPLFPKERHGKEKQNKAELLTG